MKGYPKRRPTGRSASLRGATRSRERIKAYVSPDLRGRLIDYCAAKNFTQSAVIEAALTQHLELPDSLLFLRRLDRLGRAIERGHRDLELLSQGFALFVQCWFAHAPTLSPSQKDAARRSAANRYQQFMEQLAEQFTGGHRFLDDLPKVQFPDDAELEAAAKAAEALPDPSKAVGGKEP